ncbi:MAG: hypothetical protein GY918_07195, partial [Gammaproteobacteria bacterium]|nr:hypothetical protein [Gammaproteobacteria bacterium]
MSQFVTSQGLAAMINAGKNVVNLGDAIGKPIAQGLATRYKNQRQDELLAQQTQRQDQLLADKYQREDDKLAAAQQLAAQQQQDAIMANQLSNVQNEQELAQMISYYQQSGQMDNDDIMQITQVMNSGGIGAVQQLMRDTVATSPYAKAFSPPTAVLGQGQNLVNALTGENIASGGIDTSKADEQALKDDAKIREETRGSLRKNVSNIKKRAS